MPCPAPFHREENGGPGEGSELPEVPHTSCVTPDSYLALRTPSPELTAPRHAVFCFRLESWYREVVKCTGALGQTVRGRSFTLLSRKADSVLQEARKGAPAGRPHPVPSRVHTTAPAQWQQKPSLSVLYRLISCPGGADTAHVVGITGKKSLHPEAEQ